jgi:predicted Rossmann-fold nucleotide-binding protein
MGGEARATCGRRWAGGFVRVPINDPKHWRKRAEQARALADELTDAEAKRRMLKLVGDYEELAKRAEKRLRETQKPLPSSAAMLDQPIKVKY